MRDEDILPHYLDYISRIEGIDDKARTEIEKVIKDFIDHEKSGQRKSTYDESTLSRYSDHISRIQGIDDKTRTKIEKVIREFVDYKEGKCNKDTLSCYLDYISKIQGINNKSLEEIHKIIEDFNLHRENSTEINTINHQDHINRKNIEPNAQLDVNGNARVEDLDPINTLENIRVLVADGAGYLKSLSPQSTRSEKEIFFVPITRSAEKQLNENNSNWVIRDLFSSNESFFPDVSACLIEIKLLIGKHDGYKAVNAAFTVHLIDNKLFVAYNSNSYFQGNGSEELNFNEFDIKMRYIHNSNNYIHISYYGEDTFITKVKYFLTYYLKS